MTALNKHSKLNLGPSAASRWLHCTASPQFIVDHANELPDDDTVYAEEGTQAHEFAAKLLSGETSFIDQVTDLEMLDHCKSYADLVGVNRPDGQAELIIEKKVPLFYMPERNGQIDAAWHNTDTLVIIDLKYGAGVSVEAKYNPQLAIYAESLLRSLYDENELNANFKIKLMIFQPRDRNNTTPVRIWEITRKELSEFAEVVTKISELIQTRPWYTSFAPEPEKTCKFCPATAICKAYAGHILQVIPEADGTIELPNPNTIYRDKRVKILQMKKGLEQWLEALEKQEASDLANGASSIGFKLVKGKTNRQWKDEKEAESFLLEHTQIPESDLFKPKTLISPTQVQAFIRKEGGLEEKIYEQFEALIYKPEGKPTLVPITDKREAINFDSANQLENLDII